MREQVLYLSHYITMGEHTVSLHMYDTMRLEYYWPLMTGDVIKTVKDCTSCARTRGTLMRH